MSNLRRRTARIAAVLAVAVTPVLAVPRPARPEIIFRLRNSLAIDSPNAVAMADLTLDGRDDLVATGPGDILLAHAMGDSLGVVHDYLGGGSACVLETLPGNDPRSRRACRSTCWTRPDGSNGAGRAGRSRGAQRVDRVALIR